MASVKLSASTCLSVSIIILILRCFLFVFFFVFLFLLLLFFFFFFFFNDTATTEIYTLSLHDALPIWQYKDLMIILLVGSVVISLILGDGRTAVALIALILFNTIVGFSQEFKADRKSTRLNSSHPSISYAVFCLKKKKKKKKKTNKKKQKTYILFRFIFYIH